MKPLFPPLAALLLCALSACSMIGGPKVISHVLVVDERGAAVPDAYLLFEEEGKQISRVNGDREEDYAPKSGPDGVIAANLDEYYWGSDDCYHFRIHKRGYEDTTTTVSKDLMPQVLKVELRSRAYYLQTQGQKP